MDNPLPLRSDLDAYVRFKEELRLGYYSGPNGNFGLPACARGFLVTRRVERFSGVLERLRAIKLRRPSPF